MVNPIRPPGRAGSAGLASAFQGPSAAISPPRSPPPALPAGASALSPPRPSEERPAAPGVRAGATALGGGAVRAPRGHVRAPGRRLSTRGEDAAGPGGRKEGLAALGGLGCPGRSSRGRLCRLGPRREGQGASLARSLPAPRLGGAEGEVAQVAQVTQVSSGGRRGPRAGLGGAGGGAPFARQQRAAEPAVLARVPQGARWGRGETLAYLPCRCWARARAVSGQVPEREQF